MDSGLTVALRWSGTARNVALALFALRIVGVGVFEVVDWRGVLLLFPNVFEFWFLFVAGLKRFRPGYDLTPRRAAFWIVPLLAAKLLQEYLLHGPSGWTAIAPPTSSWTGGAP